MNESWNRVSEGAVYFMLGRRDSQDSKCQLSRHVLALLFYAGTPGQQTPRQWHWH